MMCNPHVTIDIGPEISSPARDRIIGTTIPLIDIILVRDPVMMVMDNMPPLRPQLSVLAAQQRN